MNNRKVCEHFESLDNKKYIADELVKEGYGQTCGGYYKSKISVQEIKTNKDHFIKYYSKKGDKNPSYNRLRCPQLILWIAEVAGIKCDKLLAAKEIITKYEDKENLKGSMKKNGNYLDKNVKREFKEILKIGSINKIIKESPDWKTVKEKVGNL